VKSLVALIALAVVVGFQGPGLEWGMLVPFHADQVID